MPRQAEEPSNSIPPVSPDTNLHCFGWTCLTSGQQAGILVCVAVVFFALAFAIWFFLRSKKKKKEWVDENFVLVRRPRQRKIKPKTNGSKSGYTRPSTPFRHNGISVRPQAPHLIITPPTFVHVPPPPPPPVPVPVPMPMPMPFPPHQPIPIYPVAYQPSYQHGIPIQPVLQHQGNPAASVFPPNGQRPPPQQPQPQPQPQPPPQGQTQNPYWTHHRRNQRHPQLVKRPSLARRLFGVFVPPVGRASTIASSDSASIRAQSPRESHRSRASATSLSTPPSLEPRMEKTSQRSPEKQGPASPAVATVHSDDFIPLSNCLRGLSDQRKAEVAETVNDDTVKEGPVTPQRDAGEAKFRVKGQEEARARFEQETRTRTSQSAAQPREGIHHSPRNVKPGRRCVSSDMDALISKLTNVSALKKTIRPVDAIRPNGPKAETGTPAIVKSVSFVPERDQCTDL
ncbi:hypothetical protein CSOJ01_05283 [Colletotrichum sojae]|uniref:Uncharacterized protein n=1 Tax=Colletotrichum sojae TaxID=2175907 RepID=A0A8H6JFH3_9PEZI|nr:hypothetical protein CSOJ01_05283 [Colletotrichum sojae]